jgi:hypothetical protein
MAPDGRAETCSREIWLKINFNNCLIEHRVRIYMNPRPGKTNFLVVAAAKLERSGGVHPTILSPVVWTAQLRDSGIRWVVLGKQATQ